jgi:hypothetical protein
MPKEYAKKLTQLIHLVIRKATYAPTAAFFVAGAPLSTAGFLLEGGPRKT